MPTATASAYDQLTARLHEKAIFSSVGMLLSWDQETKMPPKAASYRAEQLAMMSKLEHERATASELGDLLDACAEDSDVQADPVKAANVREAKKDYDRATKLPTELVVEMTETSSRAMDAWKDARGKSDFSLFQPWLEKQVALNRRKAECYGIPEGGELYDALLEDFETGMRAKQVDALFAPLRARLTPLIAAIADKPAIENAADNRPCPIPVQREFLNEIAGALGYDLGAGRLDPTTHPFCETMGPRDVRITTRYDENNFLDALQTTLHEAGHALYEQGLETEAHFGEPRAGDARGGVRVLLGRDRRGGDAAAVLARRVHRERAPARADLNNGVTGQQVKLAADHVQFGYRSGFQRYIGLLEVGARIHHPFV